jgi:glycosyltransferase involved in cell wall biosynthesis
MKILIVYQYFGGKNTMWSSRIYEMSQYWKNQGAEITVITAPYSKSDLGIQNKFISKYKYDGLNIIVINSQDNNSYSFIRRVFNQFIFSLVSIYYSLTLNYDIILTSSGPIFVSFSGLFSKFFRKKFFVFELRDKWPDGAIELGHITNRLLIWILKKFEKHIYKNSDLLVAASIGMKNEILREGFIGKIFVAPNSCDKSFFNNLAIDDHNFNYDSNSKLFIYFGSLGVMDDVHYLVEAFELASIEGAQFLIFGDGVERNKIESYISTRKISNIKVMGILPKQEVFKWLQLSYVSLIAYKNLPALQNSSPNKLFDSLAFGIPVLHNTWGWIKDLVDSNKIGLSANPNNVYDMANSIKFIYDNPDQREIFSKNALSISKEMFDRSKIAKEYYKEMKNLI